MIEYIYPSMYRNKDQESGEVLWTATRRECHGREERERERKMKGIDGRWLSIKCRRGVLYQSEVAAAARSSRLAPGFLDPQRKQLAVNWQK